jgi:hypothetical protein
MSGKNNLDGGRPNQPLFSEAAKMPPPVQLEETKARELAEVNRKLSRLLAKLHADPTAEETWTEFDEEVAMLGCSFPLKQYSLRISFSYNLLHEPARAIIDQWGLTTPILSLAVAVPLRESSGTHGSSERQFLKDAVQTLISDFDKEKILIDVFGKQYGLPNRVRKSLEVALPLTTVTGIEIIGGTEWIDTLFKCIDGVCLTRKKPLEDWEQDSIEHLRSELADFR